MAEFARMSTGGSHNSGTVANKREDLIKIRRNFASSGEVASWYWGGAGYENVTDFERYHPRKTRGLSGRWLRSYRGTR